MRGVSVNHGGKAEALIKRRRQCIIGSEPYTTKISSRPFQDGLSDHPSYSSASARWPHIEMPQPPNTRIIRIGIPIDTSNGDNIAIFKISNQKFTMVGELVLPGFPV